MASGGRHGPDAAVSLQELIGRFYCSESSFFKWFGFVIYMVVLFPQYAENTAFLSDFPIGGIHSQNILLVIPLELQRNNQ